MARGPNMAMQKKIIFILAFVFAAGFTVLIGRLVKIQVVNSNFYAERAAKQQLNVTNITANRGTIYDRNMKALAQSATVWDVCVSPSYITKDSDRSSIADNLAKLLNMDRQTIYNKINTNVSYVVVAKKIEKSTADLVRKYLNDNNIDCVSLVEDSKRYYPYGNFASQLLGFTGTDNQGLAGIEAQYENYLKGVSGRAVTAKNAKGLDMPYDYEDYISAKNGSNVVLTIDEVVQHYLENNLKQALADNNVKNRVTGIVMNVNTGEILAMATEPGFDPNDPFTITDSAAKQSLAGKTGNDLKTATNVALQTQWRNKAITEPYEPGSVFKIVTAASALEEGVVHENDPFNDPGSISIDGTTFNCWKDGGHGAQTFLQGFENSCNVVFITVGQRLGPLNFYKYLSNFGLTSKTGIDIPGEAASITYKEKEYTKVVLASSSFGQSNKFTPIQLITAISAAANGGKLVQPHVVRELTDSNGNVIKTFGTTVKRQVISAETSKEVAKMMQLEVSEGTGHNAYVAGYRIGGKTGTSQKLDVSDQTARIASFCGVAPCDNPQYAVLFLMDEPHGSSNYGGVIAAPVVGNIMSEILPYLGVEPKYTAEEMQKLEIKTPNLVGKSKAEAQNTLNSAGLKSSVVGSGDKVTSQVPSEGQAIPKSGTVILYTGNEQPQSTVTVPTLTGLTPEEVNTALASAGLNANFEGLTSDETGLKSYEQDQAPNSKVSRGTVVTVKFRNEQVKVQ